MGGGIARAVLEAHQIARRPTTAAAGREAGLHPADFGGAICHCRQLPHGMESHLRIVRAGLDRQIATAAPLDQLVAVEAGQIDQRRGTLRRKPEPILAILDKQAGAEAEGDRQPGR